MFARLREKVWVRRVVVNRQTRRQGAVLDQSVPGATPRDLILQVEVYSHLRLVGPGDCLRSLLATILNLYRGIINWHRIGKKKCWGFSMILKQLIFENNPLVPIIRGRYLNRHTNAVATLKRIL